MGNQCCSCLQLDQIDKFEKEIYLESTIVPSSQNQSFQEVNKINNLVQGVTIPCTSCIQEYMKNDHIEQLFEALEKSQGNILELENDQKNRIGDITLQFSKLKMKIYTKFIDQTNSPNKIHQYLFKVLDFPFTQEGLFLFQINQNTEDKKQANTQIEYIENIDEEYQTDTIVKISSEKTKHSFINSSKNILKVDIFQKKEGNLRYLSTSVKNTELFKSQKLQEISSQFEQEMILLMRGIKFQNQNDKNTWIETCEIDPLNQVGLKLAKGFLLKNFKNFHNQIQQQMCNFFVDKYKDKYYDDLKWFNQDKQEVKKIIEENYQILQNLDWKFSNELQQKMQQNSQVNSDFLNSSNDQQKTPFEENEKQNLLPQCFIETQQSLKDNFLEDNQEQNQNDNIKSLDKINTVQSIPEDNFEQKINNEQSETFNSLGQYQKQIEFQNYDKDVIYQDESVQLTQQDISSFKQDNNNFNLQDDIVLNEVQQVNDAQDINLSNQHDFIKVWENAVQVEVKNDNDQLEVDELVNLLEDKDNIPQKEQQNENVLNQDEQKKLFEEQKDENNIDEQNNQNQEILNNNQKEEEQNNELQNHQQINQSQELQKNDQQENITQKQQVNEQQEIVQNQLANQDQPIQQENQIDQKQENLIEKEQVNEIEDQQELNNQIEEPQTKIDLQNQQNNHDDSNQNPKEIENTEQVLEIQENFQQENQQEQNKEENINQVQEEIDNREEEELLSQEMQSFEEENQNQQQNKEEIQIQDNSSDSYKELQQIEIDKEITQQQSEISQEITNEIINETIKKVVQSIQEKKTENEISTNLKEQLN